MISVCIVNYRSKTELIRLTRQLNAFPLVHEILVCDNSNEIEEGELSTKSKVYASENIGFSKAINKLLNNVTGEFILLLNPDMIILKAFEDFLNAIINFPYQYECLGCLVDSENSPENGIVGGNFPTLLNTFLTQFGLLRLFPKKIRNNLSLDIRSSAIDRSNLFFEVDYVSGCCLAVPASRFKLNGGFNEKYFMYFEETEYQWQQYQITRRRSAIFTSAWVHHNEGNSSPEKANYFFYKQSQYNYFSGSRNYLFIVNMIGILLRTVNTGLNGAWTRTKIEFEVWKKCI